MTASASRQEDYKHAQAWSFPTAQTLRDWLNAHHADSPGIWVILYKKASETSSVTYPEVVEEALCFGWIDSKPNKRDDQSYYLYLSPRNPASNWSQVNKTLASRLMEEGRMSPAGMSMIDLAKRTGTWTALDEVSQLIEPDDLLRMFAEYPSSETNFRSFPPSVRRGILEWIQQAKRPETREKRIRETARLAAENIRANQYRKS